MIAMVLIREHCKEVFISIAHSDTMNQLARAVRSARWQIRPLDDVPLSTESVGLSRPRLLRASSPNHEGGHEIIARGFLPLRDRYRNAEQQAVQVHDDVLLTAVVES